MQTDTVLAVPTDAAARDTLLERVRAVTDLDHPRVEPVGAAVARPDGGLVVPRGGHGTATDLATVLAVRGRCDPAEAAGLAVDLARALAALHSADLVHGGLDLADVVLDLQGGGRLRARLDLPDPEATPDGDVHALAVLVDSVVGTCDDDAAVALRAALAPALAADPRVRPEAGTLAAQVHDAVPPDPVRLPEPAVLAAAALGRGAGRTGTPDEQPRHLRARRSPQPEDSPRRRAARSRGRRVVGSPRRRVSRAWSLGGAVAGLVVVAGVVLAVVPHDGDPGSSAADEPGSAAAEPAASEPAEPAASDGATSGGAPRPGEPGLIVADAEDPTADRADPAGAAAELTRRRAQLLTGTGAPREVSVTGSAAHAADVELVERATATGTKVPHVEVTVTSAEVVQGPAQGEAEVRVEYVVGEHDQTTADGDAVRVPASGGLTADLRLSWTDDGWRVTDVL